MDTRPTRHTTADSITLTVSQLQIISGVLTDLDEFLRDHPGALDALGYFLLARGHSHPRFDAANLVDQVSFTAAWLRGLVGEDDGQR